MKMLATIGMVFLAFAISAFAGPKLEFVGGGTYDWGIVKAGANPEPLKATVTIRNAGDEVLIISQVKPTCGCTTAPISKDTLKPKETATLDITLKVSHSGAVSKTIKIYANDVDEKKPHYYVLKAHLKQDVDVSPQYFIFGQMEVGREGKASIEIVNNSDKDIKIKDFEMQPPTFQLNLDKNQTIKAHESLKVIGSYKPEKPGHFNCSVIFKTSHPDFGEVRVNGWGKVEPSKIFNN